MDNQRLSATVDELMMNALQEGGDPARTGRFLVTYKEGALDAGVRGLSEQHGFRVATAADFAGQAVAFDSLGDAEALVFPEIGVALIGEQAAQSRGLTLESLIAANTAIASIDPEFFMFANNISTADYLRGVMHTAQTIYADLGNQIDVPQRLENGVIPEVLGVTWGLNACKVPLSHYDGTGIRVAILDTGFDLGLPEFAGRAFTTNTFVGQPDQDLNGHGTHTTGTACGPLAPAGAIPRYGIAGRAPVFSGKVLTNAGSGTQSQTLAGMNWAIANRCPVISLSLGAPVGPQPAYTAAGAAALNTGCLIIAAAGNNSNRPASIAPVLAPANSPTILSVAALDNSLRIAPFSCGGKVDIAAPGVNVFSSWPRPTLHNTESGTSMATPHVTGCAALWAQSNASLRGNTLRAKLLATARHLPYPTSDVGAGLVQAP